MAVKRPVRARYSLGVDIGGTFTDFALLNAATGELHAAKVLTNYRDLARGVLDGVIELEKLAPGCRQAIERVIHGTTLATNALIQRRGAKTALLVTAGFRDLLELARESRFDIYDIDIDLPAPLVPRSRVFEVTERLDAAGSVVTALDEASVQAAIGELRTLGIEAVAVCLLHAFRNPAHERRIAALLAQALPGVAVSISSDVIPDIREYERASTTTANAYVQPAIRSYLDRLADGLKNEGVAAPLSVMTSDGGIVSCDTATRYPVRLIESGPAGGAIASMYFAGRTGVNKAIALDMGGTTAKVCVIDGGRPERSTDFEVDRVFRFAKGSGLPLKIPVIEMIEIGAGGGSIAGMNRMGLLKVGPESAGSEPGPACYGLGGSAPTVTDADLFLGYLDSGFFLGGRMALDRAAAGKAIEREVAKPLGLTPLRAAWGIHQIVNENMARAAKVHCLERGKDPREYTLIAYGGAGPVHAYRVAQILGIRRILYPLRAGVMSAFGFLVAQPSFEIVRADFGRLDDMDPARSGAILKEMEAQGRTLVVTAGVPAARLKARIEANVRFHGQSFELSIPVARALIRAELGRLKERFFAAYEARYHRLNGDAPVEIVSWRVTIEAPAARVDLKGATGKAAGSARKGTRKVYMPESNGYVDCPVYDRYALRPGQRVQGPAVIEERESTVVVGPGARCEVDVQLNLHAHLPGARTKGSRK
jgi:N-methylhydantoinase A